MRKRSFYQILLLISSEKAKKSLFPNSLLPTLHFFLRFCQQKPAEKRAPNSNVGHNGPTRTKKSMRKRSCEWIYVAIFLFCGKLLAPYQKIEMLELLNVLFWGTAKL